jgi:hypothetical protein
MGIGPLVAAAGLLLMLRVDADADYLTQLLPALLVFALGLSATVAPLTATVLADADEENAGIASGINNAIARAAGLLGVAAIGAVIAAQFTSGVDSRIDRSTLTPRGRVALAQAQQRMLARADVRGLPPREAAQITSATESASVRAFHAGMGISAVLVASGGALGLAFIRNPRRSVACASCAGGALAGAPVDAARDRESVAIAA